LWVFLQCSQKVGALDESSGYSIQIISSLCTLAFGLGAAILGSIYGWVFTSQHLTHIFMIGWCTSQMVTNILIAAAMITFLLRSFTGFSRTDRAIILLLTYAISTGLVTSLWSVVLLVSFLTYNHGLPFVHVCFLMPLGAVYTITLLANLHVRSLATACLAPMPGEGLDQSIHPSRLPTKVKVGMFRRLEAGNSSSSYNDA